jgi:hypothetical protein
MDNNFYNYLASKGQTIILINCKLFENHVTCGCALFFTKNPQRLFYGSELIKDGRRLLVPKELQVETYARLCDINNNIKVYFEKLNE